MFLVILNIRFGMYQDLKVFSLHFSYRIFTSFVSSFCNITLNIKQKKKTPVKEPCNGEYYKIILRYFCIETCHK